jgi:hypothetical protein
METAPYDQEFTTDMGRYPLMTANGLGHGSKPVSQYTKENRFSQREKSDEDGFYLTFAAFYTIKGRRAFLDVHEAFTREIPDPREDF